MPSRRFSHHRIEIFAILLLGSLFSCLPVLAKGLKGLNASAPKILDSDQNQLIKQDILKFLRENPGRKAGEGHLYLARHYRELGEADKSLKILRDMVRAEPIQPGLKYEAQLLMADIYKEKKEYDLAIKELDRLLSWNPDRAAFIKTKLAIAHLFSRGMTGIDELYKAYHRFFAKFPEANETEEMKYLMGFERGYDLEIAMRGLETWEEIAGFPETEPSDLAKLRIGLFHAYDLNKTEKGLESLEKIPFPPRTEAATHSLFVRAAISHYHSPDGDKKEAEKLYESFRNLTLDLLGYRVATVMEANLKSEAFNDQDGALELFSRLATVPQRLIATPSISLKKRQEMEEEDRKWAILGYKMAGFTCEYKLHDPDRAKIYYESALDAAKKTFVGEPDFWLIGALARNEPKTPAPQLLFDKAYEKYRAREITQALDLFNTFIASYPAHSMCREAKYRAAIINDDDLKNYDLALDMYRQYMTNITPQKSNWKLDQIYDWGRTDEIRYRIGNLLYLHRKDPVGALKAFEDLLAAYPDSYWALQGLKTSIKIKREEMGDENAAQDAMKAFIKQYPSDKDAQTYRKDLFERLLAQNKHPEAFTMLRDYLDHAMPSEKEYMQMKHQLRDLSFRLREDTLRKKLEISGPLDKAEVLSELVPVLALASTTTPLEAFVGEVAQTEDLPDDVRWSLTYRITQQLFLMSPSKAKPLFKNLAETATGPVKLACVLSLGNIAYQVERSVSEATTYYEMAASLTSPLDPWMEAPLYRLGRLYLTGKEGILGVSTLELFTRRFPQSRYLAKAYLALGEAYLAMHHPIQAARYLNRVPRLSATLAPKAKKFLEEIETTPSTEEWLKERQLQGSSKDFWNVAGTTPQAGLAKTGKTASGVVSLDLFENLDPEEAYGKFVEEGQKPKPDMDLMVNGLIMLLRRDLPPKIAEKALRHFISFRLFRERNAEAFVKVAQEILEKKNYSEPFADLLFRLAQAKDLSLRDYESANKSYFEYLSFFPAGRRVMQVRRRIPQVYENLKDTKNTLRFYGKLIDDPAVPADLKVEASIRKAKVEESDQLKDEAIKTLEAALAYESARKPEVFLRLEKITENFEYVQRALDSAGSETHRLIALKRLVKKAEEDLDFAKAEEFIKKYKPGFSDPDSKGWLEKKAEDLSKRGAISEIEEKVEMFPEERETPARLFKLANLVEGVENTKYRSTDLFYEITLVYPRSEFFKESKLRAENVRAIRSISEMSTVLKKGVQDEGDEVLLERARLYREALQSPSKAQEDYEALLKLFPNSPRRDEAYLGLGELALAADRDSAKARSLWETGLGVSKDVKNRQELINRINDLKEFQEKILYSEKSKDHEEGELLIFKMWRVEQDPARAIGLLDESLAKIENRPQAARFQYLKGRILEDLDRRPEALDAYEKALRSLYHPGCRKDRILYRMARIQDRDGKADEAYKTYVALISRYPKSLYCRSALYWLYKKDLAADKLTGAHARMDTLLGFQALAPYHRKNFFSLQKDLAAKMNLQQMVRLQGFSKPETKPAFHYYIGKVLENDLRDYERALGEYEKYLESHPPIARSRELLEKMADLAARKGDHIRSIAYLDNLLKTMKPAPENLDLVIKIGDLVEDKLGSQDLANLFYERIAADYAKVPSVRNFAKSKIHRIAEKRMAKVAKPKGGKKIKREYSEDDDAIIERLDEIKKKYIDDLQEFTKAEREMVALWDENTQSPATIEIMKELVSLNEDQLMDPQKAAEYYERWLAENPDDLEYESYIMKLYELYMEKVKDGQKALRLLEKFVRDNPNSPLAMEADLKVAKTNEMLVKNWDEARRIYQRIIDTKRNDPIVHEAYFHMGYVLREGFADYASAIQTWTEMNNLFYNNAFAADAQYAMAFTYEAYVRDYTKARENYEKILSLYPNSPLQNQVREALLRISGKK